jgi:spore maturation protein CgeB
MIAFLWEGSTTLERARIIEGLGVKILPFDMTSYHAKLLRLEQSIESRFNIGRGIRQLNHDLMVLARSSQYDVVWITKGNWIYPETVEILRKFAQQRYVIHQTNDAIVYNNYGSRYFFQSLPLYSLCVTTKPWEVDMYRARGAREVYTLLHAHGRQFSPDITVDAASRLQLSSDICFVGHCERHYANQIRVIGKVARDTGATVKIWGPGWPRYARRNAWALPIVQSDGLWGQRYPQALASAKIALGLLNKQMPETSTSRTFEIPATGTFMLAERTAELQALYKEGKEAEFFSSTEELYDKARFYLHNDASRRRIAAAGRKRCVTDGYSAKDQMHRLFEYLLGQLL